MPKRKNLIFNLSGNVKKVGGTGARRRVGRPRKVGRPKGSGVCGGALRYAGTRYYGGALHGVIV